MPIYEYVCSKCEKTTDVMQKVNEAAPETCPNCNAEGTLSRQVSRTSFVLKGGGWYSDLYGSSKRSDAGKTESSAKSDLAGGSGSSSSSSSSSSSGTSGGTSSTTSSTSSGSSEGSAAKKAASAS